MALVKVCDFCSKTLGGEDYFVQIRGSISDQYEPGEGVVEFRYLTNRGEETHTFCDDSCEMDWRDKQRETRSFTNRVV